MGESGCTWKFQDEMMMRAASSDVLQLKSLVLLASFRGGEGVNSAQVTRLEDSFG